jgi:phosphohistidine phosphatase SixA
VTRALLALLALLALAGCGEDEPAGKDVALAKVLKGGGVVLVMRHTKTETATDEVEVLGDCSKQRNLSDEGREQARQIGRDVKDVGVPVKRVLASPLCRAKETADLAFGHSTPSMALLSPGVAGTIADDDRRIRRLRTMTSAPAGSVTVLVTHTGNIGGAFHQSIEEGDMLVMRDGKLVGRVRPDDWKRLKEATG